MGKKLSYEYVKEYIESFNYQLLSDTYKDSKTKLLIKCPEGHEYEVTWSNFKTGYRCPICYGNKKYTYEYVKGYIESFNYQLLSDTYINNNTKLLVRCPLDHEYYVIFANFQSGKRCPFCKALKVSNDKILSFDYVKSYIESFNYTLLSKTYINSHMKLLITCPSGHEYEVNFNNFKQGQRCPICWNESTSSKQEQEVQDYVESLGYRIIRNDRTQIINPLTNRNLELDIWIPDKNKAIEYNGTYWHNKLYMVQKDKIKVDQCKQKGIDLLVINEDKWTNSKNIEQDIIAKFLEGKL